MITPRTRASKQEREASILELLSQGPCTKFDIVKATGITTKGFYHYRRSLKGKIHVQGWTVVEPGWPSTPVYALGDLPDVPRPITKKTTEQRKYRTNRKAREAAEAIRLVEEAKKDALRKERSRIRSELWRKKLREQGLPLPKYTPKPKPTIIKPEPVIKRDPWISAFFGSVGVSA